MKWELRWGGKWQGKEKATQQFAEPDAASLGHKMKWLWCNVKLHIDLLLSSFFFISPPAAPAGPRAQGAGFGAWVWLAPVVRTGGTPAWPGCPHPEGMLLERFGLSAPWGEGMEWG